MQIKEIMTARPELISTNASIREAAMKMAENGIGFLPVGEGDKLRGTLTDRDIVLNAVARGNDQQQTTVGEIMSKEVLYCRENHEAEEVAQNMCDQKVRRFPVVDENKRFVGVVSMGDLAQHLDPQFAGKILKAVTSD